jgi:hypothetical protein
MAENQPKNESGKKKNGLYIVGAAVAMLVIGYFVLTKVNADASNWAGAVAPIMIIGGYITVAVGILVGWDD